MHKSIARSKNPSTQASQQVRELLGSHGIRASKALGQNFLVDTDIPEKMARLAVAGAGCGVLEIGPGLGALTIPLAGVAGRVAAVELDPRLVLLLREKLRGIPNVEVIQGDIMKMDIAGLVKDKLPGMEPHVCSNLPYGITTPLLAEVIGSGVFKTVTVMVQREVAGRIDAAPGSPEYGAFSVFVRYHAEPEILFDVPPECFYPKPEVFSSVVRMRAGVKRLQDPEDEAFFFRVVRAAFSQRRKTLVNALCASLGGQADKGRVAEIVRKCVSDDRIRGEALGVEEFIGLAGELKLVLYNTEK